MLLVKNLKVGHHLSSIVIEGTRTLFSFFKHTLERQKATKIDKNQLKVTKKQLKSTKKQLKATKSN